MRMQTIEVPRAVPEKDPFLSAWKRGVRLAGEEYFTCDRAYRPAPSVAEATNKWQLIPKWDLCERRIKTRGASQWERVFLAALCSFYNDEWGTGMLRSLGVFSPGQMAVGLDSARAHVIADLLVSYRGW